MQFEYSVAKHCKSQFGLVKYCWKNPYWFFLRWKKNYWNLNFALVQSFLTFEIPSETFVFAAPSLPIIPAFRTDLCQLLPWPRQVPSVQCRGKALGDDTAAKQRWEISDLGGYWGTLGKGYLSVHLSTICLHIHLSIYPPTHLYTFLIYLSIYLSFYLSICLSIYLSIYIY